MPARILLLVSLATWCWSYTLRDQLAAAPAPELPLTATVGMTESNAVEFVQSYCVDCHQGEDPEAGLNLEAFESTANVVAAIDGWRKIADRVHESQMPPDGNDTPSPPSRKAFVTWIRKTIHSTICDDGIAPGAAILRRLNRTEYANTVRDLLGIHINAAHALPADGAGGEGFDNATETLYISPIHAPKYLDAARSALRHALRDPGARSQIIGDEPKAGRSPGIAARNVLSKFLPRAFRRPIREDELDEYVQLFNSAYEQDPSFDSAIQLAIEAAMVSPKFLLLCEEPNQRETPVLVSQHELASRLSYFLWASMPDSTLMRLADEGKLHDEEVLTDQVVRMLHSDTDRQGIRRDAKVRGFAASFTEQWLGTRALGREFTPDPKISSGYDSELQGGMKYEPIFFFEDLLAENRSLLNLIDSDFTYVNRRLARHYQIPGAFREQPKRAELPEHSHRGGVLGMSAVLAVSSYPHRTSPVLRGKWVLETLLGTPPPPPPPNVSELDETTDSEQPESLRERLERHRADSACASCHAAMDPLGFALENYDVLGRWRTDVEGLPINARGQLPDGTVFDGPEALKKLLLERKQQFIRNLSAKVLGFALGRGLTNEDYCVVEAIVEKLQENEFRSHTLIVEVVKSVPFRYKQGRNDQAAVVGAIGGPRPEEEHSLEP